VAGEAGGVVKNRQSLLVIMTLFVAAIGLSIGWWLRGLSDQDACLDAGGKWEDRGSYCLAAKFGPPE
jgi:hypothetical protein